MKIRGGFVSNSSSSSFILLGCKSDIISLTPKDLSANTYYVYLDIDTNEGTCIFEVADEDMLAILQHELVEGFVRETWLTFKTGGEQLSYRDIKNAKVPKHLEGKVVIETFNQDHHIPEGAGELLGQLKYELDEAEYQELVKAFPKIKPVEY